jgi:uncharacterized protein
MQKHILFCLRAKACTDNFCVCWASGPNEGKTMSEDPIGVDHMDYAGLTQNALRSVIRQALQKAALPEGLPAEHHFYITFLTSAPGVTIPSDVLARYPRDMTIVLQHQYRDLKVYEDYFNVTLSFGGAPKVLRIPFNAISRFCDPAVHFALDFEIEEVFELYDDDIEAQDTPVEDFAAARLRQPQTSETKTETPAAEPSENAPEPPKVVSLEQFRKK